MTRIAIVEWPDGLLPESNEWTTIRAAVASAKADILITNEMPFGEWLPKTSPFDVDLARSWSILHEEALAELNSLEVPTIVSSRPILMDGALVNEAFLLERGTYRFLHQKHLFPAEPGWQEASWFQTVRYGFEPLVSAGTCIGALLCTELMFSRCAKLMGPHGVHLIASPRASGSNEVLWRSAAIMAAASSGAYVASSNRISLSGTTMFGGGGFMVDPSGNLLGSTTRKTPIVVIDIDEAKADAAKAEYPAYVDDSLLSGLSF